MRERLEAVRSAVEAALDEAMAGLPEGDLADAMRYACIGGKRLRALLVMEGARLHGVADAAVRVAAALDRFGLRGLARNPARALSGGEQQRLALARAWVMTPELLLLDEPCASLDPSATRQVEVDVVIRQERRCRRWVLVVMVVIGVFRQSRRGSSSSSSSIGSPPRVLPQVVEESPLATPFP